ncbi:MAG: DUF2182 domain-containing protein [Gammaproteobacteria bacterium]
MSKLVVAVAVSVCAAWGYLYYQAWHMTHTSPAQMWMPPTVLMLWPVHELLWVFAMWAVMMAAMMLPAALPMLAAYSRYCSRISGSGGRLTAWFAGGYLAVWLAFSIVLTFLQWLFHGLSWLSPMMESRQPLFAAAILAVAGLYQFTPFKNACLQFCRTPFGFLVNAWRPGKAGALYTGLKHGLNCLGCCWAQMLVMFALGVMNLGAMALMTLLVVMEKWVPLDARKLSYGSGVLFLLWSGYFLLAAP